MMSTKKLQFVRRIGNTDQFGNKEFEFFETEDVERNLKNNYGFINYDDGFAQRIIDWFFEETDNDNDLLKEAKKVIHYVNEQEGEHWISMTIEQWLILEHTRWLLTEEERLRKYCWKLEDTIKELKQK